MRLFRKRYGLGALVISGIWFATSPVAAQEARPNGPDQELVRRLHQLGQDEIAMARMGEARGERADVRAYAASAEREQRAADDRLVAYAARKNMNLPEVEEPGGALEHGTLALAPLANSPAREFDYTFATRTVANLQATIDASTAAERLARDPELRALIDSNLRMSTQRLMLAEGLAAGIPAPAPRALSLPAYPAGVSRTQTGADVPPPQAFVR